MTAPPDPRIAVYVLNRLDGQLHRLTLDGPPHSRGMSIPEAAEREAKHRGLDLRHVEVQAWEPFAQCQEHASLFNNANPGMRAHERVQAFYASRVADKPQKKVARHHPQPANGTPQHSVQGSGAANWFMEQIAKIDPVETPYMQKARQVGKTEYLRKQAEIRAAQAAGRDAMREVFLGKVPVAVVHDEVQTAGTDRAHEDALANQRMINRDSAAQKPARRVPARIEPTVPHTSVKELREAFPGLVALSPMDGRLGNRWAP